MVKKTEIEHNNLFKLNGLSEKEIKNLDVFDLISRKGLISRTDISKTTGINIVSISNYVNDYIDKKLIMEKGLDVSSGGRKPELVELDTKENHAVGIDLGQKETRVALVDLGINVVGKTKAPPFKPSDKDPVQTVISLIEEIIKKSGLMPDKIKSIGIGVSDNRFASIAKNAEKHFGIPVFYGDEPLCAAFGERRLNKDADVKSMLYMHSDLGVGVVVDGAACEIADESSEKLRYLKPWPDLLGIVTMADNEVAKGVGTKIVELASGKIENITEDIVIEAAAGNDEVASNIINSVGINLGLRTAYLINLFLPSAVVIGGGVEKAGEPVLATIRKMVGRLALSSYSSRTKIVSGVLQEDAVSFGAASLAIREIFLSA